MVQNIFLDPQLIELFNIEPAQLDGFLSLGWFRIQQTIFTTDIFIFRWAGIRCYLVTGTATRFCRRIKNIKYYPEKIAGSGSK